MQAAERATAYAATIRTRKGQSEYATGRRFRVDRGGTFIDAVARTAPTITRSITRKLVSEDPERYKDAAFQRIRRDKVFALQAPPCGPLNERLHTLRP